MHHHHPSRSTPAQTAKISPTSSSSHTSSNRTSTGTCTKLKQIHLVLFINCQDLLPTSSTSSTRTCTSTSTRAQTAKIPPATFYTLSRSASDTTTTTVHKLQNFSFQYRNMITQHFILVGKYENPQQFLVLHFELICAVYTTCS